MVLLTILTWKYIIKMNYFKSIFCLILNRKIPIISTIVLTGINN